MKKGSIKDLYKRARRLYNVYEVTNNYHDLIIYLECVNCIELLTGHTYEYIRKKTSNLGDQENEI